MEVKNLRMIETGKRFGNMNISPQFYNNLSKEEREKDFLLRRMALGEFYGFDGRKMFAADQEDKKGTYHILTKEDIEVDPEFCWIKIPEDMLVITTTEGTKNAVIGQPVADCPVVVATNKNRNIAVCCHCSAQLIDMSMPMMTIDALINAGKDLEIKINEEEIECYISSAAGPTWTYDKYPNWASDISFWSKFIDRRNGLYFIDIKSAVYDQLLKRKIKPEKIVTSSIDTITNNDYFSNSAAHNGNPEKSGRNFVGVYYQETDENKNKSR